MTTKKTATKKTATKKTTKMAPMTMADIFFGRPEKRQQQTRFEVRLRIIANGKTLEQAEEALDFYLNGTAARMHGLEVVGKRVEAVFDPAVE